MCVKYETASLFILGNGYIDMEELKHVLTRLQIGDTMTPEEVQAMLSEADVNGDGQIDYNGKIPQSRTRHT